MTKQRKFYVPEDCQQLIDKLVQILRREGKSLSRWILENAVEYVKRHEPGNPQLLMNNFAKPELKSVGAPPPKPPAPVKGPCCSCRWLDPKSYAPRGFCTRKQLFIAVWALKQGHGCDEWVKA